MWSWCYIYFNVFNILKSLILEDEFEFINKQKIFTELNMMNMKDTTLIQVNPSRTRTVWHKTYDPRTLLHCPSLQGHDRWNHECKGWGQYCTHCTLPKNFIAQAERRRLPQEDPWYLQHWPPPAALSTKSSPPLRTPAEPTTRRNAAEGRSKEPESLYQTRSLTAVAVAGLACSASA